MIKIINADKYYNRGRQNELHVINNINLELPDRGMVAIFGKSGCGKTTLLNVIGGLDRINSGMISVNGVFMNGNTDEIRNRDIGYIFQNYNLNKNENVFENVADALRLCGMTDGSEIENRVMAALRSVEMDKFRRRAPDNLSGGQQQRVAIARAIVKNPSIILADEPTGNLDEASTVMVMDLLKEISRDRLVLLVTHEESLVEFYCDRVIGLFDGSVVSKRENTCTRGYVHKNKNDIFLGDLESHTVEMPGVSITYYGDITDEIKLKIVNDGGKLYLQSNTQKLRILDASSEIKLIDGKYSDAEETRKSRNVSTNVDMSSFGNFEGKKYGRLFNFKQALALAWHENFTQKLKKSNKLLRACLFMMAFVLVFMTAASAVSIREYNEIKGNYNKNIFFMKFNSDTDLSKISDSIGQNGIDYTAIVYDQSYDAVQYNLTINPGNYVTAKVSPLSAAGYILSADNAKNAELICGTTELTEKYDILISSALADELVESSGVNYIDSYEDLLGLMSRNSFSLSSINNGNKDKLRITGVVEGDSCDIYMNSLSAAEYYINNMFRRNIVSDTNEGFDRGVKPGEIVYVITPGYNDVYDKYDDYGDNTVQPDKEPAEDNSNNVVTQSGITEGATVRLYGRTFTVSEVIKLNETDSYAGGYSDVFSRYVVMNDDGFLNMTCSYGDSDAEISGGVMDDYIYSSCCLMIHAYDPEVAGKFLSTTYSNKIVTPDKIFKDMLSVRSADILANIISILSVLALMCLCVFFIMRSSLMKKVREIGIYRAIGVSKKNLIFRFVIETMLLTIMTVFIGFVISSGLIMWVASLSLISQLLYLPLWLAVSLFAVIFCACLIFGTLPLSLLLNKTPSEILAKYDI